MIDADTSAPPDPRRYAYRQDIASADLRGRVEADRFVEGWPAHVARAAVPLRREPETSRGLETEALFGESVTVFEEAMGWAWIQLKRDGYVGYVPSDALAPGNFNATHKVCALGTFVYPVPDIKAPPLMLIALNAELALRHGDDRFVELDRGGFVFARHVTPIDRYARDFVEIAERFVGAPYLWGGRTRVGVDCSGLVQTALNAAGIACPRDSDMQQAELGISVDRADYEDGLARGDLVFWRGHVGIMLDAVMMVHANAHHMMVAVETLPEAAARIARAGSEIVQIKRLPELSA